MTLYALSTRLTDLKRTRAEADTQPVTAREVGEAKSDLRDWLMQRDDHELLEIIAYLLCEMVTNP